MTIDELIASKPECLRLGQYFVNEYWSGSDEISQHLYNILDDEVSEKVIRSILADYNITELRKV